MIQVLVKTSNEELTQIIVKGHAGSGPYGHDLVCAGVSAVVYGGLNSLEDHKNYKIDIKEGLVTIDILNKISEHDKVVFETMLIGLKSIEETNSKNIKIKNL